MRIERFAPSPTGYLHLGHGFSALMAARYADRFLLRIEDTDTQRCRPTYEAAIYQDLAWLELNWETPVLRQSDRAAAYVAAIDQLAERGLVYPCICTRRMISQIAEEAKLGPDGIVYPGTCRGAAFTGPNSGTALRLDMRRAVEILNQTPLFYEEIGIKPGVQAVDTDYLIHACGDIVLWRKDTQTAAYHLAVVVDDAAQGITHVTRGVDVAPATSIHRLLQALLGFATPTYNHHRLITDDTGKRLAKSFDSKALRKFRAEGVSRRSLMTIIGI